jgi:hypothetical protein
MILNPKFEPDYFWKNFRLGSELQISGAFIYNGLFTLENMKTFHYEEESFEFLYQIAVGIERLEKVAIVLLDHDNSVPQELFEKSLRTHNHVQLLNRIKKKRQVILNTRHDKFLDLLTSFYKSTRYDRFRFSSVFYPPQDQHRLIRFISDELNIKIGISLPFSTGVTPQIKSFLGEVIGKIVGQLHDIVQQEASRLNALTYELPYDSKAFKIFNLREFDFVNEKLMQREALLYVLKKFPMDGLKKFIEGIDALPFDNMHTNKYLESIMNFQGDRTVVDEMEHLYEVQKIDEDRKEAVMVLGSLTNFDLFQGLSDITESPST